MLTPPQLVHRAHGSPLVDGCRDAAGACYLCGGTTDRSTLVAKWMGAGFSDHTRAALPHSEFVCEACCYVTSRVSPVLGRPPGKCGVCDGTLAVVTVPRAGKGSKSRKGDQCPKCDGTGMNENGGSFRNVSHLYESGWPGIHAPNYGNASKGEKAVLREFLARDHAGIWFAAIGDSGQLHVLPFATLNGTGRAGTVLFDRQTIRVPVDQSLITEMVDLLTHDATKTEIASGDYGEAAWRLSAERVRAFEARRSAERGSGWFTLALWLAQRDEAEVERRRAAEKAAKDARKEQTKVARGARKTRARRDGDVPNGAQSSVHADAGAQGPEALDADAERASDQPHGSGHGGDVAGGDTGGAKDRGPAQLRLFGV